MLRRSFRRLIENSLPDTASYRSRPWREHLVSVIDSPYKESFKEYWSTPVPWVTRDYGAKPKPGDPIPLRDASTILLVAKNNHVDPALVEAGEENDYKVLMMYREAKGRYTKDQFVFPSNPTSLEDSDHKWGELLPRLKVTTPHPDITRRIAAIRALFSECNVLVIPPEGGGIVEVEGPPGSVKKWHMIVWSHPGQLRNLLDILALPYETALKSLLPFRRIQTPPTEMHRFDNMVYIVPFEKMPCVRFNISTIAERLIWVSPKEAIRRFNSGVMEMPTPNLMLMAELDQQFQRWEDIPATLKYDSEPGLILPELVHDPVTRMATVLMPGDVHHSTSQHKVQSSGGVAFPVGGAAPAGDEKSTSKGGSEDAKASAVAGAEPPRLRRFQYAKDDPWGVRAVYFDRPVHETDELTQLAVVPHRVVEIADTEKEKQREVFQRQLPAHLSGAMTSGTPEELVAQIAQRSKDPHPHSGRMELPAMSFVEDSERLQMNEQQRTPVESLASAPSSQQHRRGAETSENGGAGGGGRDSTSSGGIRP